MATRRIVRLEPRTGRHLYEIQRTYTFWNFMLDVVLTLATAGWWLVWVIIRQLVRR